MSIKTSAAIQEIQPFQHSIAANEKVLSRNCYLGGCFNRLDAKCLTKNGRNMSRNISQYNIML